MSLLSRVFLMIAVALVPAAGVEIYNESALRAARRDDVREQALREARLLAAELDRIISGIHNAMLPMAELNAVQAGDPDCNAQYSRIAAEMTFFSTLTYVGTDGHPICSSASGLPWNVSFASRPAFRLALERGGFTVGTYISGWASQGQLGFGMPVRGADGVVRGVLLASMDMRWLRDQLLARDLPPDSSVTVADRDGVILARLPEEAAVGEPIASAQRWMINAREGGVTELVEADGVQRIVGYQPLREVSRDLFVSVGFSTASAYAAGESAAMRSYMLLALGLALAAVMALLTARHVIARPVEAILDTLEGWRRGDRSARVQPVDTRTEIGRIGRAVDDLLDTVDRREDDLRERLAEIRAIYDTIPVGLAFLDPDMRHVNLNLRLAAAYGGPVEAFLRRTPGAVLPEMGSAIETLLQTTMRSRRPRSGVELRGRMPSVPGMDRVWLFSFHPVLASDQSVLGVAVAVMEVTDQRRTEAALRETTTRLALAQDALGIGTFEWEDGGETVRWSAHQYVLHGVTPQPGTLGPTYEDWLASVHPDDRAHAEGAHRAVGMGQGSYETEYRVVDRLTGEIRWVATRGTVVADASGRVVRAIGVNYDVTARRTAEDALSAAYAALEDRVAERTLQLEAEVRERERTQAQLQQSQKMEVIGQLSGGIAHDFNNLLTAVTGNIELARMRNEANPDLERLLLNALRATERGAALTHRMLAFARRQYLHMQDVDVPALLRGMEDLLSRSIGPTVQVKLSLAPTLWPVRTDPNQLELVVLNLAINARDAMPQGGTLTISANNEVWPDGPPLADASLQPVGTEFVCLRVADMGEGMDPETLNRVFEPFFTTKPPGKGSGLGLSMVHGVVVQSGGGIAIDSTPGNGTVVALWLPRSPELAADEPLPPVPPLPAPAPDLTGAERDRHEAVATILVVEDDPAVAEVAEMCLQDAGYRVLRAASGPAALEYLRSGSEPDLVVADFAMPGMKGTELAAAARAMRPGLPFLLATGYAAEAAMAGDVESLPVLGKPYRAAELVEAVAGLLARRRVQPGAAEISISENER
jgi:signal transduction histidine kinase/ActR/RegA family two-component response regulator